MFFLLVLCLVVHIDPHDLSEHLVVFEGVGVVAALLDGLVNTQLLGLGVSLDLALILFDLLGQPLLPPALLFLCGPVELDVEVLLYLVDGVVELSHLSRELLDGCRLGNFLQPCLFVDLALEQGRILKPVFHVPYQLRLLCDLDRCALADALQGVEFDEDLISTTQVVQQSEDGRDDIGCLVRRQVGQHPQLVQGPADERLEEARVEFGGQVLVEQVVQEDQSPKQGHEDAVILEFVGVELEEV